jgi:hypothetical protein
LRPTTTLLQHLGLTSQLAWLSTTTSLQVLISSTHYSLASAALYISGASSYFCPSVPASSLALLAIFTSYPSALPPASTHLVAPTLEP